MKKVITAIGLMFVLAWLTGCASPNSNLQHNIDRSETSQMIAGKSTKEDVRAAFGPPHTVALDANGNEIWSYTAYQKPSPAAQAAGLAGTIVTLGCVGMVYGALYPDQTCKIFFDNEGIVQSLVCKDK